MFVRINQLNVATRMNQLHMLHLQYTVQKIIQISAIYCNMTCTVVENMILLEIFRVVSRFPHYISGYIAENRFHMGQCRISQMVLFNKEPTCQIYREMFIKSQHVYCVTLPRQ